MLDTFPTLSLTLSRLLLTSSADFIGVCDAQPLTSTTEKISSIANAMIFLVSIFSFVLAFISIVSVLFYLLIFSIWWRLNFYSSSSGQQFSAFYLSAIFDRLLFISLL